jgi:hypothetical protein
MQNEADVQETCVSPRRSTGLLAVVQVVPCSSNARPPRSTATQKDERGAHETETINAPSPDAWAATGAGHQTASAVVAISVIGSRRRRLRAVSRPARLGLGGPGRVTT